MPVGGETLLPPHGGYRSLKTFRLAELLYDVTVRFCDRYIERRSRTHDQMVQSARSGSRNIAEGSVDSATSKKMELKLTGVARGSLEELKLDYQSYLRQRGLPEWPPEHPVLKRFRARRCATLEEFRLWVADEVKREEGAAGTTRTDTDNHGRARTGKAAEPGVSPSSVPVRVRPCRSVSLPQSVSSPRSVSSSPLPPTLAANGALSLLNLCIHLLGRQLASQAAAFEKEGGFTERLHRVRSAARRNGPGQGRPTPSAGRQTQPD